MKVRRDVFQGIADPTRRAILRMVDARPMKAGAIAGNFKSARATVSKHLQILKECDMLVQTQNGRELYYRLNPKKLKQVADFIRSFGQTRLKKGKRKKQKNKWSSNHIKNGRH